MAEASRRWCLNYGGTGNGRASVPQHVSARNPPDLFTLHVEPWPPGSSSCFGNDSVPLWNVEHCLSSNEGSTQSLTNTHQSNIHETHTQGCKHKQTEKKTAHLPPHKTSALPCISTDSDTLIGPFSLSLFLQVGLPVS